MQVILYGAIFLASAALLYVAGEWVVRGLMRISRFLRVREFVVAFFVMAFAASLPNLFLGLTAATGGIPELSLGDIFGNNLIAMTIAVAFGVFFARGHTVPISDATIRPSMLFTAAAAVAPVILLLDGELSRQDGVLLLLLFFMYVLWLLLHPDKGKARYNGIAQLPRREFLQIAVKTLGDTLKVALGVGLLGLAALGIVTSASFFAGHFGIPLLIVGVLIVGLGNALPEVYFSIISARRGDTELIMGNLIGSVIVPATLVLGLVAIVAPIHTANLLLLAEMRLFLLAAAALFFVFAITRRSIGVIEATILLALYAAFVITIITGSAPL